MSKKLSSIPTCSTPRTSRNSAHRARSRAVRGARPGSAVPPGPGAGSARRSSFPLGLSGTASRGTTADGTMYAGSRSATKARSSPEPGAAGPATGTT